MTDAKGPVENSLASSGWSWDSQLPDSPGDFLRGLFLRALKGRPVYRHPRDRFTERLRHLSRGAGPHAGEAAGTGRGLGGVGDLKGELGRSRTTGLGSWPEVEGREMPSPLAFAAGAIVDSDVGVRVAGLVQEARAGR